MAAIRIWLWLQCRWENGPRRLGALPAEAYDCFMVGTLYRSNRMQAWFAGESLVANGRLPSDPCAANHPIAAACRRARVRQGRAFGGAEEAPSLTLAARDGDGNMRSGRKNARGAGRTKEWKKQCSKKGVRHR